jgi:hypothetical protein
LVSSGAEHTPEPPSRLRYVLVLPKRNDCTISHGSFNTTATPKSAAVAKNGPAWRFSANLAHAMRLSHLDADVPRRLAERHDDDHDPFRTCRRRILAS